MIKISSPGVFSADLIDYDSTHSVSGKIRELIAANAFAVCDTAGDTAAKTVTISDFELREGIQLVVKFTNANSVQNPTLNVSNTGAKPIYANNQPIGMSLIKAGYSFLIGYDGTNYIVIGGVSGSDIFIGTTAEWNALTTIQKAEYDGKLVCITDDTTGGGGESGGHTILDEDGTFYPQQDNLKFGNGFNVTDDDTHNATTIDFTGTQEITYSEWQAMTPAERSNGTAYYIIDYPTLGGVYLFETKDAMDAAIQAGTVPNNAVCLVDEDTPYVVKAEAVEYGNTNVGEKLDELSSKKWTLLGTGSCSVGVSLTNLPDTADEIFILGNRQSDTFQSSLYIFNIPVITFKNIVQDAPVYYYPPNSTGSTISNISDGIASIRIYDTVTVTMRSGGGDASSTSGLRVYYR